MESNFGLDKIEYQVMSGLKDFQRETVERIATLYENGQRRVLVSDEVGLGKTLIARGTIAKYAQIAKKQGKQVIKVIYICSNAAIADQNLAKLCISGNMKRHEVGSSRLSIQHLHLFMQEAETGDSEQFIQLIPLTPDTSFRMTHGAGIQEERAIMYQILIRIPELKPYRSALETLMIAGAESGWYWWAKEYGEKIVAECDRLTQRAYLSYMTNKVSEGLARADKDGNILLEQVIEKCKELRSRKHKDVKTYGVIGKLRYLFAGISLDKLEPDLVIMDEFQRFKYLIRSEKDMDTEMGMLAHKFFHSENARMLLLSATPYKMYSTLEEIDESLVDEHFSEFLDVMKFLNITKEEQDKFKTVWNNYSVLLREFTSGDTSIIQAKKAAEDALYGLVCRTERISAKDSTDLTRLVDRGRELEVEAVDIRSYMEASEVLEKIGVSYHVPMDYIKSCPYIMSFMKDYKLKKDVEKYFSESPEDLKWIKKDSLWLNQRDVRQYKPVKCGNARLERVKEHIFKQKAELLLWVPPCRPYYPSSGVYKGAENFSKTLIFSSWEMVPRMVSSLLSYEAERKTVGRIITANKDIPMDYFNSERKPYPGPRMRFAVFDRRLSGMNLFCLLYPSKYLTDVYDPIDCMNRGLSLSEIEKEIRGKIAERLDKVKSRKTGAEDQRWYYMAPLFLDPPEYVMGWFDEDADLAWNEQDENRRGENSAFLKHLRHLRQMYYNLGNGDLDNISLGRKPKALYDVLTDMAIASPAVCANRTYGLYGRKEDYPGYLPGQLGKVFINLMNKPESIAVVEIACGKKSDDAHWRNVLTYCKQGNLQAVLDEYAHLLVNGYDEDSTVMKLHGDIVETMNMRTTRYEFDTYQNFCNVRKGKQPKAPRIRTHFAVAFTKGVGTEKDTNRKKVVRNAFNSPFRPFVLTSTSIGQEGLDFHNYCRRIVHWNLPANPIDLEQREGRINRFECLAIRQNVAKRYGSIQYKRNVWKELFEEAARQEKTKESSDLVPYWGLQEREDMIHIERIVPMYPFSRDKAAYERLMKILSLYRLTLGQARQEELLEYFMKEDKEPEQLKELFINLSPYFKKYAKE